MSYTRESADLGGLLTVSVYTETRADGVMLETRAGRQAIIYLSRETLERLVAFAQLHGVLSPQTTKTNQPTP